MIRFLLKGILKDKSRSLLPIIVVSLGVALIVIMNCWLKGVMGESIEMNARFNSGHLKVMTRAYAEESDQMPNDLAIIGSDSLTKQLKSSYPQLDWVERIRFGGLIDFPDEKGETRAQGPAVGWAIDLFSSSSREKERFNLQEAIVAGRLPDQPGEALITEDFARRFGVVPGTIFTLFGTTMEGSMAFKNFTVAGTVRFGSSALDRGAIIIDLADARAALGMEDCAGEVVGFFNDSPYDDEQATLIAKAFNSTNSSTEDEFAPTMLRLRDQGGMAEYLDYSDTLGTIMIVVFILAMAVVLWNAGLLGGLRRYTEFGLRLALGEEKRHIYTTLIYEGLLIGLIGTITGTMLGLLGAFYLQEVGINISGFMKNSSLMMPSVVRAQITPSAYYIGLIPGIFSMVLGNALSGIGIYKRQTAHLFKELEN